MKTFPELVALARLGSENVDYTDTTGIQDSEIYQYFTDATRRLESVIFVQHPKAFLKSKEIICQGQQEYVDIPADCYMKNRLLTVEWAINGRDFYLLKKGNPQERFTGISGDPIYYIPFGGKILLKPNNSISGTARLLYQHSQPAADYKRGIIKEFTVDSGTKTISSITLDTESPELSVDEAINSSQFLTIVDRYGNVKLKELEITGVDTNNGIISLYGGSHVYDADESIAVCDYVCIGDYSSFKSSLSDNCERYLLQYAIWKMQKRDSNVDSGEAAQELLQLEGDIVASFAEPDSDVDSITILDTQYIGTDYDGGFY